MAWRGRSCRVSSRAVGVLRRIPRNPPTDGHYAARCGHHSGPHPAAVLLAATGGAGRRERNVHGASVPYLAAAPRTARPAVAGRPRTGQPPPPAPPQRRPAVLLSPPRAAPVTAQHIVPITRHPDTVAVRNACFFGGAR